MANSPNFFILRMLSTHREVESKGSDGVWLLFQCCGLGLISTLHLGLGHCDQIWDSDWLTPRKEILVVHYRIETASSIYSFNAHH